MIDLIPSSKVKELKKSLSKKRFIHSTGVLETSLLFADSWNALSIDRESLAWAALFHDCAKELPKEERNRLAQENSFQWGKELLDHNKLNHAPLSAKLLHERHGIENQDILMAIAYHPTGHPDLTPIGWAVYIADYLEPNRNYFPEREEWLKKACQNPLDGLRLISDLRIRVVKEKNIPIHPLAIDFDNYLKNLKSI